MKRMIFLIVGLCMAYVSSAQSIKSYVITNAGAAMMNDQGALYISIGEPMNTELEDGEIMISQGFLQVTLEEPSNTINPIMEEIIAYPNPTGNALVIEIPEMNGEYFYQLTNANGQLVQKQRLNTSNEKIEMTDLESGMYFLRVSKSDESSRTLKIVKL